MSEDYCTPPEIVGALGQFDLDPCTPVIRNYDTATTHLTALDNGLTQEWSGRVWLHPPLKDIEAWIAKMADHGSGICLTFAATHEAWFHEQVFARAHSIFFFKNVMRLYRGGAICPPEAMPCCLVSWSQEDTAAIAGANLNGFLIEINQNNQ